MNKMNKITSRRWLLLVIIIPIIVVILVGITVLIFRSRVIQEYHPKNQSTIPTSFTTTSQTSSTDMKTYTNAEFGFEFKYPANWTFEVNGFYSPFSKFNLEGDTSAENYNPFRPHFLLNIVTADFADRAVITFKNLNASTSIVTLGGIRGIKYEYEFEGATQIAIDLPFGEYRMILGTEKQYENIFNQILASFKFLK